MVSSEWQGQLVPGAAKDRAGSAWPSDFNTHGFYGPHSNMAMENNTDHSCSRTYDPDWLSAAALDWLSPWPPMTEN